MDRSNQELLTCMASGDVTAFTEFFDRHSPRVFSLLCKWLGQRGDAEDVLQETFWQVWTRAGQYDAARSLPEVWLVLIARSRALDYLRRHRNGAAASLAQEPATLNDPGSDLERDESLRQLRTALADLPEEQRTAINLAFYGGLTHEQVARCQAVPLGTVKTRIRLGMKKLRSLLGD